MRVVHIGHDYGLGNLGGAAIAASRLHCALLAKGVESYYVTNWCWSSGENVIALPVGICRKIYFYGGELLRRVVGKLFRNGVKTATNLIPLFGLQKIIHEIKPDVVHIHWLNADVMSFEQLEKMPCPVVVHLHDLFMINAIEPYPGSDARFKDGFTPMNSTRMERAVFHRKMKSLQRGNVYFIGPSDWVVNQARESLIGKGIPSVAIPNVIDQTYAFDMNLRKEHSKFTLLFGAFGGRKNPIKGWQDLEAALLLIGSENADRIEVKIFGENETEYTMPNGVKVYFLGPINEPEKLMRTYHSADVFAFPSKEETQGMTKVEAMLCGLPVLAFDRTACAEGIRQGWSGWVAPDGDIESYAEGIRHFIKSFYAGELEAVHASIASEARKVYNPDVIVEKIVAVYGKCGRN